MFDILCLIVPICTIQLDTVLWYYCELATRQSLEMLNVVDTWLGDHSWITVPCGPTRSLCFWCQFQLNALLVVWVVESQFVFSLTDWECFRPGLCLLETQRPVSYLGCTLFSFILWISYVWGGEIVEGLHIIHAGTKIRMIGVWCPLSPIRLALSSIHEIVLAKWAVEQMASN